jgi:hypothetical protein
MAEVHLSRAARALSQGQLPPPPPFEEVRQLHTNADTDADTSALHHTVGSQPAQASPGDHTHDGGSSNPLLQGITISGTRGTAAYNQSLEAALVALGASNQATG